MQRPQSPRQAIQRQAIQRQAIQRQAIQRQAIQRQAIPAIPVIRRPQSPRQAIQRPAIQRPAIPAIPPIPVIKRPSVSRRQPSVSRRRPSVSQHQSVRRPSVRQNQIPFQTRRRHRPSVQNNLKILTDMGFNNTSQMTDALMKHNNDIERAIHELTSSQTSTHDERIYADNLLTTNIKLLHITARKNFIIQDNGGAGDCLFLSLHDTLTRANPLITQNKTAHDIRLEIVDFIMRNLNRPQNQTTRQTFENAIHHGVVVNDGKTLHMHNYEREMSNRYTYGTELEISAAAQLYKMNIYVVNRNGISFDQLYIGNGRPTWHNTWYIFNINNAHYTSLICIDGPDNCPPGDM
jgi:hypothetical protein